MQIVEIKKKLIKHRKHITFLIFGIFFFPIIFQSVHIVWHHSQGYKCQHYRCFSKIVNADSHSNTKNVSEKEKICPICEYRFSINDLPKIFLFNATIAGFSHIYVEIIKPQQYKRFFSDKTPRAPPILRV